MKKEKTKTMGEITELREKNRKVFLMSDGSKRAEYHAAPIYTLNEKNCTLEEVDRSLHKTKDGKHFANGKNNFAAKFNSEEQTDELFSIEKGEHRISVVAKTKNKRPAPTVHKTKTAEVVAFKDAENGVDYEYSVKNQGVKENIIIKEKQKKYKFSFVLECQNLTAQLDETKQRVAFLDSQNGQEIFFVPAPFMQDANGAVSTAVKYALKPYKNNSFVFTVTADSKWLNAEERAFPVTLDPQIMMSDCTYMSTYSWKNGTMYSAEDHVVGITENGNVNRMYMHFSKPSLPKLSRVKKVELRLYQIKENCVSENFPKLALYAVSGDITIGECTPAENSPLYDYCKMIPKEGEEYDENNYYSFDITRYVNLPGLSDLDFVFRLMDENIEAQDNITIHGMKGNFYDPTIYVTYESSYGVNTSYRAHTHDLGRFGQGSVDIACGNLMFEPEDFAWAGNRMPVSVKHLYNSALHSYQYTYNENIHLLTANFSAMKIGNGWKLNFMQSLDLATFWDEERERGGYLYIDENGEEHYLKDGSNGYQSIIDSSIVYDPSGNTLKNGTDTYIFDDKFRLIRIIEENNVNQININYTNDQITSVTDSVGRTFTFAYDSEGYLTEICAPDGTKVMYEYVDNFLTKITYPDSTKTLITYDTAGYPSAVTLQDASGAPVRKIEYTYLSGKVRTVTEYGVENGEFVLGASSQYSFVTGFRNTKVQTTIPADADIGETENTVINTVYTFDDDGELKSEYVYTENMDNIGVEGNSEGVNPYFSEDGINTVNNSTNLFYSHNNLNELEWDDIRDDPLCSNVEYIKNTSEAKFGKNLIKINSTSEDSAECGVIQCSYPFDAGKYVFSAYVKVLEDISAINNPGMFLRVIDSYGEVFIESEHVTKKDNQYVRIVLPFEIKTSTDITFCMFMSGKGSAYVCAPQLERGSTVNKYNMLENGNFEQGTYGWTSSENSLIISDTDVFEMNKSLAFSGDLDEERYAYQDVAVKSDPYTRESFTLSGWAKNFGVIRREREGLPDSTCRLIAEIHYAADENGETETERYTADFASDTIEWNYASVEFSKAKCKPVDFVRIYCDYSYNNSGAYFDNIQLIRNSIETDLSASDFGGEDYSGDYEETEQTDEAIEAPAFEEVVDAYGNALTETTFTDGEFGTIYRTFKYNEGSAQTAGNDLIEETDARGNTTRYTVDPTTSRNTEVIDRCGNKTAYEYDSSGRTTKVISKNSANTELANVSYAYDAFGEMKEIIRGDNMKYLLEYNPFHNLESIGIKDKTEKLVSYAYKNGTGRLKEVTYANGDTMKASYNGLGQLVSEKWYNSANTLIAHYKYLYDGEGNIVRSIDLKAEKEYTYSYEDGKLIRSAEYDITLDTNEFVTSRTATYSLFFDYNSEGELIRKRTFVGGSLTSEIFYEKNDDSTVVKFKAGGKDVTSHSKSDSFGRKLFDELQLGTGVVSRQFSYYNGVLPEIHKEKEKIKSTPVTQLVSRITFSDDRTISYEYDNEERITKVIDSVDGTTEYTYDALGQLLLEKHKAVGAEEFTTVNAMVYNNYGNILTKNGKAYAYDSTWKDLLTSYNGQTITYDAQGNPTSYLGHALTWEKGRQLKSYDGITFTYNANGIRTSKTVDGNRQDFVLEGTKILSRTCGSELLVVLYDNEDSVCGIEYQGTPYYFHKNLQGDIIAIADKDGEIVARYTYDAWGKPLSVTDGNGNQVNSTHIANINPFRYRGYYYDTETGLYYLQSRYYDPEVGRFISSDKIQNVTILTGVSCNNLYGYCVNNPIIYHDKIGEYPILAGAGLQVAISISFGGISIGAGFELIYFWTKNFKTNLSSRFLLYFFFEPLNFNIASLKNAININTYYRKMSFNPKKLISKPKFNASVSILSIWIDHRTTINYKDYESRFDTWTIAGWGIRGFKSWSKKFTVIGAGKYWGISGSGVSRSVSNYWKVCDIGNSMKNLMNSIKRQGEANA